MVDMRVNAKVVLKTVDCAGFGLCVHLIMEGADDEASSRLLSCCGVQQSDVSSSFFTEYTVANTQCDMGALCASPSPFACRQTRTLIFKLLAHFCPYAHPRLRPLSR